MGQRGPWMEMAKAKREQGDAAAAQQMRARRAGKCDNCGATVGPEDLIRWDRDAKKTVQCRDCGLSVCGRIMLAERGTCSDTSANDLRRARAQELAICEAKIARLEARKATATGDELAKVERMLASARERHGEAVHAVKGLRGEPAHARPSARDIELAREAVKAAQEKRDREEAEERAAQVADALSPAARSALRFYAMKGEFRAIGATPPAELEAGTAELVKARLVRPWCESYEPTPEGDAVVIAA